MAKISEEKQWLRSNDGRELEFKKELHVDKDGIFKISLPYELYESLPETANKNKSEQRLKNGTKYFVMAKTLNECEQLYKDALSYWRLCESSEEFFIMYHTESKYCFYEKDGEKSLFGDWDDIIGERPTSSYHRNMMLKLSVAICKEVTYTTSSTKKVSVERIEDKDLEKLSEYANKLYKSYPLVERGETHFHSVWKKLPLNEENAKFFYGALISIGVLADKITNLFGDSEKLQKSIDSNSGVKLLEM